MRNIKNIKRNKSISGFTFIEIIVVMAVIGILASITLIGYGSWRSSTTVAQLKSDLNGVSAAMENSRTFSNAYPASVPASFVSNSGTTFYGGSADGKIFCVAAKNNNIRYYITNGGNPTAGICPPANLAGISGANFSINLSWGSVDGATGYKLQRSDNSSFTGTLTDIDTNSSTLTASSTSLLASTTYYYRLSAKNDDNTTYSIWSKTVAVSTRYTQVFVAGANTSVTVPANTPVLLEAWGGQGGSGGYAEIWSWYDVDDPRTDCIGTGGTGGSGGHSKGTFTTSTVGQQLAIVVGAVASNGGNISNEWGTGYRVAGAGGAGNASYVGIGSNHYVQGNGGAGGGGGSSNYGTCYDGDAGTSGTSSVYTTDGLLTNTTTETGINAASPRVEVTY